MPAHRRSRLPLSGLLVGLLLAAPASAPAQGEDPDRVRAWVHGNEHRLVRELRDWLAIPNVAADGPSIRRNVEWLTAQMEARGLSPRTLETGGPPMVFGERKIPGARTTILLYSHYDGQPADPSAWVGHDPWEPVLRDGSLDDGAAIRPWPETGPYDPDWRVYARSASDDKSPILMMFAALDALEATGLEPAVNLKFLFEGDEEAGSAYMRDIIRRHTDLLDADLVVMADGPEHPSGRPTLVYGARGITTARIIVYGPERPLHSGHFGNWAPNPAMRLAELLATMKDDDGRVRVAGWYDDVRPMTGAERRATAAVPPDRPSDYGFAEPESGEGSLRLEATALPSLNVRGLRSGWVGAEARTIVPDSAVADLDLRLVPDIQPADQVERLRSHIEGRGYFLVEESPDADTRRRHPRIARLVARDGGYPGMRTPMDHPVAREVAAAVRGFTGEDPVRIPMLGGSVPAVWFPVEAEIPVILIPTVNPDNNQHSPNENLRLGHFFDGIITLAGVLRAGG